MITIDDMKVRAGTITTQDVQIKDFISFNFQCRPLENFDILNLKKHAIKNWFNWLKQKKCYPWFATWQGLEVNMHDVVFWGWNTTAKQPPQLSTDGKRSKMDF